ncbi:MAG TPA: hypothetical protein VK928_09180, partial [Longimicrobiales bacterium]|nr:hypothetical protein [Longimicrobiales bacterium]
TDAPLNRTVVETDIHVSDPAAAPVIHEFTTTRISADTWRARAVISDPDGTLDELHIILEKAGPLMGFTYSYPVDLCDVRGRTSVTCEFDLQPGSLVTPESHYTAIAFDSSGNASTPVSAGPTGY